ncbi:restriction endonuclease subunit S [Bacteroides uniformis]|nr:restriction endonuclease subunit S [Bacteroides uniformis]RHD99876.1 restriction endonuclease subunit S [Bacteroides uniformis]
MIGNVPHLRFPEFSGEWEKCKVSDLLDFYSTNSLSWEQLEYDTNAMMNLHYGLIHVGLPTMVDLAKDKLPNIKENNMPKNFELCKEGDVAFADASEDTNEVAKTVEFFNLAGKNVVCGLHTIHGRDNKHKTVVGFKGYAFSSAAFHNQIRRIAQGTKIYSISTKNFFECYIGLPSKPEQSKIATLLRLIDERIATQNKIIEDLKLLKSAIIEEHYKQSEKQCVLIADLGEPFSVGNLSKDDLTDTGTPCVIYGELFTTYREIISHVESYTNKSDGMTFSKKGDLLFPSSTTVDAVSLITPSAINIDNVVLGGDMFGIHINSDYNAQYLSYYFNHIAKKQFAKYAKGSTIIHLHYKDIEKNKLLLPCLIEQNKTANNLISLDEKIKIESSYLQSVIKQKTYLLRQMFI